MFSWPANCFEKYIKREESVLFSQVWRIDSAKVSALCLCNSYFIYQVRTYSTLCAICTVKREFSQWCTHAWFAWRTAGSTHVIWVCSYVMLIITAQVTVTTRYQPIRCSPNAVGASMAVARTYWLFLCWSSPSVPTYKGQSACQTVLVTALY